MCACVFCCWRCWGTFSVHRHKRLTGLKNQQFVLQKGDVACSCEAHTYKYWREYRCRMYRQVPCCQTELFTGGFKETQVLRYSFIEWPNDWLRPPVWTPPYRHLNRGHTPETLPWHLDKGHVKDTRDYYGVWGREGGGGGGFAAFTHS